MAKTHPCLWLGLLFAPHVQLMIDQLLETANLGAKAAYISMAYKVAFQTGWFLYPTCNDGYYLMPATQQQCPGWVGQQTLTTCSGSTSVNGLCASQGECGTDSGLHNCVYTNSVAANVYVKQRDRCSLQDGSACSHARWYFGVAMAATALTVAGNTFRQQWWLRRLEGDSMGPVWLCWADFWWTAAASLPMLLVPFLCVGKAPLIGMGVAAALIYLITAALQCCFAHGYKAVDSLHPAHACADAAKAEVPLLGIAAAYVMGPGRAKHVAALREPYEVIVRLTQDAPHLVVTIMDLAWFGSSWYAILDLVFCAFWIARLGLRVLLIPLLCGKLPATEEPGAYA